MFDNGVTYKDLAETFSPEKFVELKEKKVVETKLGGFSYFTHIVSEICP